MAKLENFFGDEFRFNATFIHGVLLFQEVFETAKRNLHHAPVLLRNGNRTRKLWNSPCAYVQSVNRSLKKACFGDEFRFNATFIHGVLLFQEVFETAKRNLHHANIIYQRFKKVIRYAIEHDVMLKDPCKDVTCKVDSQIFKKSLKRLSAICIMRISFLV